jgi:hypothetical protein
MSYHMPQHGYHPLVTVLVGDDTAVSHILSEPETLTGADAPGFEGAPQTSVFRIQKRRPTTILTTSEQFSTSDSTPLHSATDIMSDSEDKKRNKLGYQRISIACGTLLPCRPDVATRPLCRVNTRRAACMCNANSWSSSLSSKENSMPTCRRRLSRSVSELHPAQEGMCVLPG